MNHLVTGVALMSWLLLAGEQTNAPAAVPGIIPSGFGEAVDRDVARVRAATEGFKVAEAAIAAGYAATTNCIAHPKDGGMGLHYRNEPLRDGTLDVEHPEFVMYAKQADGTLKMTGVEYVVPIKAWTGQEPPRIMAQPLIRDDKLGIFYLHAWIWEANPSGLFASWNPKVTCEPRG